MTAQTHGLKNGIPEAPVPHYGWYSLRARVVLGGGLALVSGALQWRSDTAVQDTGHISLDTLTVDKRSELAREVLTAEAEPHLIGACSSRTHGRAHVLVA